jgi:uncharacterized phage infection (PIP) family protein YhgE
VRQAVGQKLDEQTIEKLAEEISKRVTENVIEYFDESKNIDNKEGESDHWIRNEDTIVCEPCLLHARSSERPQKYAKYYKSSFGSFDVR